MAAAAVVAVGATAATAADDCCQQSVCWGFHRLAAVGGFEGDGASRSPCSQLPVRPLPDTPARRRKRGGDRGRACLLTVL